jgi:hypothetical protein
MSVKIQYKDEIRRVAAPTTYTALQRLASTLFSISTTGAVFTYVDEDNDKITVSSDQELKEALSGPKVPKMTIQLKNPVSVEPKPVPVVPVAPKQVAPKPVPAPPSIEVVCRQVMSLASNAQARNLARKQGFDIMRVAWEDTARSKGSCVGPNITDMTLNVNGHNMPLIRPPNYTDCTWDVPMDKIMLVVGNDSADTNLRSCSLDKILQQIWEVTDLPFGTNLYSKQRDSHVLVQAQACFLPIAEGSDAKFNVAVRNYQSSDHDSACLILTMTSKGTSAQLCKGGVTKLYFNDKGQKRSFLGQRLKDDRRERGVALEGDMTSEEKQNNVIVVIQIPLKKQQPRRRKLGFGGFSASLFDEEDNGGDFGDLYSSSSRCTAAPASYAPAAPLAFLCSENKKSKSSRACEAKQQQQQVDVENVIVKLAEKEGAFESLSSKKLERDHRFPVRVTLQYYKGTSNGQVNDPVLSEIAGQMAHAKKHASAWGSLVVQTTNRPTEPQPQQPLKPAGCNHTKVLFSTPRAGFACDVCNVTVPKDTTLFGCRTCDWDTCLSCKFKADASVQVGGPPSLILPDVFF